jgi:hypothetical protein
MNIVTSRTQRRYLKKPRWPFEINYDSPQAVGLQFWWPCATPHSNILWFGPNTKPGLATVVSCNYTNRKIDGGWCLDLNGSTSRAELANQPGLDFGTGACSF